MDQESLVIAATKYALVVRAQGQGIDGAILVFRLHFWSSCKKKLLPVGDCICRPKQHLTVVTTRSEIRSILREFNDIHSVVKKLTLIQFSAQQRLGRRESFSRDSSWRKLIKVVATIEKITVSRDEASV